MKGGVHITSFPIGWVQLEWGRTNYTIYDAESWCYVDLLSIQRQRKTPKRHDKRVGYCWIRLNARKARGRLRQYQFWIQ